MADSFPRRPTDALFAESMRLREGDNHLISERDGLVVCQIWERPDLSSEQGAKNADQLVTFLEQQVLRSAKRYRGIILDARRAPIVFGPQTRGRLSALFSKSAANRLRLAVLCGESATQVLQFRSLCAPSPKLLQVFENEAKASLWLRGQ
jgi:hypothetical protein